MLHLHVVPYIEGDIQDADHLRVAHHHVYGLSGADVMINGERRQVRGTSRVHGRQDHYNATILVHLKPLCMGCRKQMQCKSLPDRLILQSLDKDSRTLSYLTEYLHTTAWLPLNAPNLMCAKMRKLIARGYVSGRAHRKSLMPLFITDKGRQYLEKLNA